MHADTKPGVLKALNFSNPNMRNGDFMNFMGDLIAGPVQSGRRTQLCNSTYSDQFKTNKLQWVVDQAVASGLQVDDYDIPAFTNTTIDVNKAMRQWTYQVCTEFGFFQEPWPSNPIRPSILNHAYWIDWCQRIFGPTFVPQTDITNSHYKALEITGSNIFFLTSSEDPWQGAGMVQIYDPVLQKDMKAHHIVCENCSHCVDLHGPKDTDAPELVAARQDAMQTITKWLYP